MTRSLIPEDYSYEIVAIDSIQQHPENPNNGDTEAIGESLAEFGFYVPITCQRSTRRIIRGNHTWLAAKTDGAPKVPVVWRDVDDDTALRILVGDNEIASRRRPDLGSLERILTDLRERNALRGTGHTADTVSELIAKVRRTVHAPLDAEAQWCEACGQKLRKKRGDE